jgi:hypothetical protein
MVRDVSRITAFAMLGKRWVVAGGGKTRRHTDSLRPRKQNPTSIQCLRVYRTSLSLRADLDKSFIFSVLSDFSFSKITHERVKTIAQALLLEYRCSWFKMCFRCVDQYGFLSRELAVISGPLQIQNEDRCCCPRPLPGLCYRCKEPKCRLPHRRQHFAVSVYGLPEHDCAEC